MTGPEQKLTLIGHFLELRKRLIRSIIAVIVGIIISFFFWKWIFYILIYPAQGVNLIFTEVTEMFGTTMKVCLAAGIILAMPFITYQFIMFVRPALTGREKKYLLIIMPWVTIMFLGGVVFGYFVMVPPAVRFFLSFGSDLVEPLISVGNYISVITRMLLAIGLVFELPVVTTFLARIGIVKPEWLASKRKIVIVLAFIIGAILTPPDPTTQVLLAVPLIVLYEMSIWLAKLVYKRRGAPVVEEAYESSPGAGP
jgi:sec-independent protein translocase protein TatC